MELYLQFSKCDLKLTRYQHLNKIDQISGSIQVFNATYAQVNTDKSFKNLFTGCVRSLFFFLF